MAVCVAGNAPFEASGAVGVLVDTVAVLVFEDMAAGCGQTCRWGNLVSFTE